MIGLTLITVVLFGACLYFMRAFVNQKTSIETLKQELDLSNEEYIDLFKENIKIYEELSSLRVLSELKHL
jgi:hypothetical protein